MKEFLPLVTKPVRYLGREINSVRKDPSEVKLRFCLAFPDVYEVGMSHLGIQILYHILNSLEGVACERAFAPWVDMEKELRKRDLRLASLETSTPLREFDLLGFSLQYELSLTNVLNMLDLSGIPVFSKDRDDTCPLLIAGGPTAFNPAPVADFFDAIVIGDGEEVVVEICDHAVKVKEAGGGKEDLLRSLGRLEGIYVPSLHPPGQKIRRRLVPDLNLVPYPTCPIVPYMKVVHDRLNLEIARGCKRGCRFCQAGFIHRPYRERSPDRIKEILDASLKETGYEEFSLLSLSAGDYSSIGSLLSSLMDRYESKKVAASFPSLRIEKVVGYLADQVKRVRKTGFTVAPEAGTERLRSVINKELDEDVLFKGLMELFSKGWRSIKLYFMMGLPTETQEDLKGVIDLAQRLSSLGKGQKVHPNVSVSVSTFVPKPHTPFQWESEIPLEVMKEKLRFLKDEAKRHHLHLKWQDPHLSQLEGIFSVGDRKLSRVLVEAHRLGCRFDGWSDQFQYPLWKQAFERAGLTIEQYVRKKNYEEDLPWSFIETGVQSTFLREESERGMKGEISPACREKDCRRCGLCDGKEITVKDRYVHEIRPLERLSRSRMRRKVFKRKVRLRFTKRGSLQFLSHLELAHLFYRVSRKAGIPLSYSEGFHPMPKIIFATALPVGMESLSEIVDLELEGSLSPVKVKERLNPYLPEGIEILEAEEVPLSFSRSFLIRRTVYWIRPDVLLSEERAKAQIEEALKSDSLLIQQERKGKERQIDVRPLIERMEVKPHQPGNLEAWTREDDSNSAMNHRWGIELILRNSGGKTAKPTEILGAILGLGKESLSRCEVVKIE